MTLSVGIPNAWIICKTVDPSLREISMTLIALQDYRKEDFASTSHKPLSISLLIKIFLTQVSPKREGDIHVKSHLWGEKAIRSPSFNRLSKPAPFPLSIIIFTFSRGIPSFCTTSRAVAFSSMSNRSVPLLETPLQYCLRDAFNLMVTASIPLPFKTALPSLLWVTFP